MENDIEADRTPHVQQQCTINIIQHTFDQIANFDIMNVPDRMIRPAIAYLCVFVYDVVTHTDQNV